MAPGAASDTRQVAPRCEVGTARGLQKGDAVPVITTTSAAANVTAIAGGISVFGDPLPADALGIVIQILAFAMVIAAAALTPGPLRAAGASAR